MKRTIGILLLAVILLNVIPLSCFAQPLPQSNVNIIYLDNGSYIIEEIVILESRALNMTTGTKTGIYCNGSGEEEWRAVLTGTFSYNGSSATCTVASCDITIINTNWYTISKSAERSGNSARCSVTMGLKALGVTVDEESISLKLTCDPKGNLS